jgi:hypothetical protein
MPTVFNKYHKPPSTAVYIGRGSPWGNPFVIGKDGDRDTVCDKYAAMVESDPSFKARVIANLRGKDLVCFCAPQRCHGDYLLKVANAELRGRPLADGPA